MQRIVDGNRGHQRQQRPTGLLKVRAQDDTEIQPGVFRRNPLTLQTPATRGLFRSDDAQAFCRALRSALGCLEIS